MAKFIAIGIFFEYNKKDFMFTTKYIISQIIALFAYASITATMFVKSKIKILLLNITCSIFFFFHYLLLGASVGMYINVIGTARGLWFYLDERFNSKHLFNALIVCLAATLVSSIYAFSSWVECFALIAGVIFTYSLWQKNIGFYRWSMLICSILWVVYNILHYSIVATFGESILIIIEIVSIVKYYRKDKSDLASTPQITAPLPTQETTE
ncbi:MAG: YgjV family protein [bacterium]|nr:YgjV family protein [bacterium]